MILAQRMISFYPLVNVKALVNLFIINVLSNGWRARFQENKWVLQLLIVGRKMSVKFVKQLCQNVYKRDRKILI